MSHQPWHLRTIGKEPENKIDRLPPVEDSIPNERIQAKVLFPANEHGSFTTIEVTR
jgi:hypothetical protein